MSLYLEISMESSHFRKAFALLIAQFFKMPFTVIPKKMACGDFGSIGNVQCCFLSGSSL